MKSMVLAVGTLLALAVSGPAALQPKSTPVQQAASDIVVPAWMQLPSRPFISSIEYSGQAGVEAAFGTILYELPTDGSSEVAWITEHLKEQGFQVDDRTSGLDNFAGADMVISASEPVNGRRLNIVAVTTMHGSSLRITFEDPTAESYISLL